MTATSVPDDGVSAKNAAPTDARAFADPGLRIDNWTVEPSLNRMSREGRTLALEPKTMAVLVYLAERPGMLVTRRELDEAVWSGMVVGYDALTGWPVVTACSAVIETITAGMPSAQSTTCEAAFTEPVWRLG